MTQTKLRKASLAGVSTWSCVSKSACLNWMICSCRCALWFLFFNFFKFIFHFLNPRQRNLLMKQFWSFWSFIGVFSWRPIGQGVSSCVLLALKLSKTINEEYNFFRENGYARICLNSLFRYNVLMLIKHILTIQEHSLLEELDQP